MSTKGAKRSTAFFRGSEGMRRTDEEIALAKQRADQRKQSSNNPFRFRVPVGETRRIIICDEAPDFFMYEHSLKDADGNWGRLFTGCVRAFDNCPICEANGQRESYYAMMLTCIDLTPFTTRDGTEVEFSRKLLCVKPAQQKKFLRFYNKEGTLRGAMFDMTRDGDKDSQIGNDIEFVDFVDEDEMASYTRSWKDKDGKKHTENCDEPYVYEDLFEEPTVEKLRAIVGGSPTPGSREHDDRAIGGRGRERGGRAEGRGGRTEERSTSRRETKKTDDWSDADDDDLPFDPDERPARGRSAREETDDEPARGRGKERSARRPAAQPEEDEEPARPSRRAARAEPEDDEPAPRRGLGRRTAREEPEDEPEDSGRARRGRR